LPKPKRLKSQFTLEECKSQINIVNGKAFLNLQTPDGRWLVFESVEGRTVPEFEKTSVVPKTTTEAIIQ
jgi:hypothetical protein